VIATTAASSVLLAWLVPPPLVLPALSFVSFMAAGIVALFAYYSGADRHADVHNALGRGGRIRVDLGCRRDAE
jgi:Na+-driven multidrug efflux pump